MDQADLSLLRIPQRASLQRRLLAWYRDRPRALPWRLDWERLRDPYRVWLSEIMLQQTVIKAVIPVYRRFLDELPTIQDLAKATEDDVRRLSRGLGYYRRFGLMKQAADHLATQDFVWPTTFAAWKTLPGVGDYTAAAVSSIAFDQPEAVVDGNVERVFCRLFDIQRPPNERGLKPHFKRLAAELLDPTQPGDFNQALMELGQLTCRGSDPDCESCPFAGACLAHARQHQHLAPQPKIKTQNIDVAMHLVIPTRKGEIGLIERPATAKFLKSTWGFPTYLSQEGQFIEDGGSKLLKVKPSDVTGKIKHSITKHRITASVQKMEWGRATDKMRFLPLDQVEEALIANLDRKALQAHLRAAGKSGRTVQ